MINFLKNPGDKILELGCGTNPHPLSDVRVDVRPIPGVTHFVADFALPFTVENDQGISSDEFAGVFAHFVIEHLPYRSVPGFLKECLRVLRPGGIAVMAMPNTAAQMDWIRNNPAGWDGKNLFESASEKLFGSQNMPDGSGQDHNTHKAYFSAPIAIELFTQAGFTEVQVRPYGERETDMLITAKKPMNDLPQPNIPNSAPRTYTNVNQPQNPITPVSDGLSLSDPLPPVLPAVESPANVLKEIQSYDPKRMFNRGYFDGGSGGWGGYGGEGYRDFPAHNVTAKHVLDRKPTSVIEYGAGRGYVLKRIQDAGVTGYGADVSKHCILTRVCEGVHETDLTKSAPDPVDRYDLCYSVGFLDHIPASLLPKVIKEMVRVSNRGLHGINFDLMGDGDRTRLSAGKPKQWWVQLFQTHAPGWPVEILDKNELETAPNPDWCKDWLEGDGRAKVNVGSYTTMFHHGWENVDVHDLKGWAASQGYRYRQHDVRNGMPYHTASIDLIYAHHFLEHLNYKEGAAFLRECRRVLRPTGALRLVVPDAKTLIEMYTATFSRLELFDELNPGCAECPTPAGKLYSMLCPNHHAFYDPFTLESMLEEAGFNAHPSVFRNTAIEACEQILRECLEMDYLGTSLFMDATPRMD